MPEKDAEQDDQSQVEVRARDLARRVMGRPPEKQEWPKKTKEEDLSVSSSGHASKSNER